MSVDHYENFPVASILMPARLRPATETVYAFARSADDIADEGDASDEARLSDLDAYLSELQFIEDRLASATLHQPPITSTSRPPLFQRLLGVIYEHQLPVQAFRDLISAFKQDVVTKRYASFTALLDYCARSANPVGRIMLHLYRKTDDVCMQQSDAICSALQLINFWQDVAIDWQKQRIYLPLEDLHRFGVTEDHIAHQVNDAAWKGLMRFEVERARALILAGAPLATALRGRIGWELRLVVQGGLRILESIEKADYDVFRRRPKLGPIDWCVMLGRALCMRSKQQVPKTM